MPNSCQGQRETELSIHHLLRMGITIWQDHPSPGASQSLQPAGKMGLQAEVWRLLGCSVCQARRRWAGEGPEVKRCLGRNGWDRDLQLPVRRGRSPQLSFPSRHGSLCLQPLRPMGILGFPGSGGWLNLQYQVRESGPWSAAWNLQTRNSESTLQS